MNKAHALALGFGVWLLVAALIGPLIGKYLKENNAPTDYNERDEHPY